MTRITVLMDEPISAFDPRLREQTRLELAKLLDEFAITLHVTHDQQEAIAMGDPVAILRDGRIEQVGPYDELYYAPVNRFVGEFIGRPPMAVLPAAVDDGHVFIGGNGWRIPASWGEQPSGEIQLGLRPEGWRLGDLGIEGLPMTVHRVERLPAERVGFLRGTVGAHDLTVLVPVDYPDVDKIIIVPDLEQAYVFAVGDGTTRFSPGVFDPFGDAFGTVPAAGGWS